MPVASAAASSGSRMSIGCERICRANPNGPADAVWWQARRDGRGRRTCRSMNYSEGVSTQTSLSPIRHPYGDDDAKP